APGLGGTLATIQGYVSVSNYSYAERVTLILDNSGNNQLGPLSTTLGIYDTELDYYEYLQGFGTGGVYWSLGEGCTVDIRGGAADDTFSLLGTAFRPSISIDGGGGVNTLDYSAIPSGVYVNLQTGQATGVAGTITRIQNVVGSAGNDILVGNGGNVLSGGAGRDLLSAGALASQLYGGGDEDILIGGTLNANSRANLDAIMAEWTRTGDGNDYASRVARLRTGLLADGTITGNGGGNTLTGEGGLD